jgi:ubiquinone/menaquinone biosynthesis C-methylase UbiE
MTLSSETTTTVASVFDEIAEVYDTTFTNSAIGLAQRKPMWKEIDQTFVAGQRILEINCGTGVDALHLARRGVDVVACDSAPRMIAVARKRSGLAGVSTMVDFRVLATEKIRELQNEGPFDGILSNFAGLNCISDVSPVAHDLAQLVKARSKAILCLFGHFCLWETAWYLSRGYLRKAVRRLDQGGRLGALPPHSGVKVWYHPVRRLKKIFSPQFRLKAWKGVGVAVPPSYLKFLATRYPRLFHLASEIDPWLGKCPGLRAMADHMLLTFERTET